MKLKTPEMRVTAVATSEPNQRVLATRQVPFFPDNGRVTNRRPASMNQTVYPLLPADNDDKKRCIRLSHLSLRGYIYIATCVALSTVLDIKDGHLFPLETEISPDAEPSTRSLEKAAK